MSAKKARLRYVNESVGAVAVAAMVLFVAGVFLAGRSQGWFEGTVNIDAVFMDASGLYSSEQGSFDLQEGNEVKIRSAKAGQVVSIEPLDDGGLKAVLKIKRRFHRFVRVDSVARVKKRFGLAGDAHIEISEGRGSQIEDRGTIPCYRDEEIMEIAKQALQKLEDAVVPMVEQTSGVMSNANRISGEISAGDGLLATIINDPALTEDVRASIRHLNDLLRETSATVAETRRLVQGVQRHWLIRKYMPEKVARSFISPLFGVYGRCDDALERRCVAELQEARKTADSAEVARTAYNLSICRLVEGRKPEAELLLQEARLSKTRDGISVAHHAALRAMIAQKDPGALSEFIELGILEDAPAGMEFSEYSEFLGLSCLLLARSGRVSEASEVASMYCKKVEKRGSQPAIAAFCWGLALIKDSEPEQAASLFDREAKCLAGEGLEFGLAAALARGGDYYSRANQHEEASMRYLAAAKSLRAQGFAPESDNLLDSAATEAQVLENKQVAEYIQKYRASLQIENRK